MKPVAGDRFLASLTRTVAAVSRRKSIYELLHPETRHGAVGRGGKKSRQIDDSSARFTTATAKATGKSERKTRLVAEAAALAALAVLFAIVIAA
jgi:hypothetical protein